MRAVDFTLMGFALISFMQPGSARSEEKKSKQESDPPCTIRSNHSGSFFDLNHISITPLPKGKKPHKDQRTESWRARGYDYPANFTLNVCAPVVEDLSHVVGVDKHLWRNVSAYYERDGKTFSIG